MAWLGFYFGIRALSGLWRAARVPHPLLFSDRPAAQNVGTGAAFGVSDLRDGRRSRMSATHPRTDGPYFATEKGPSHSEGFQLSGAIALLQVSNLRRRRL